MVLSPTLPSPYRPTSSTYQLSRIRIAATPVTLARICSGFLSKFLPDCSITLLSLYLCQFLTTMLTASICPSISTPGTSKQRTRSSIATTARITSCGSRVSATKVLPPMWAWAGGAWIGNGLWPQSQEDHSVLMLPSTSMVQALRPVGPSSDPPGVMMLWRGKAK